MDSISGDSWRLERNGERERIVSEVPKIFESFEIMMHKNRCEHYISMKMPLEPLQCYYALRHLLNFPAFAGGALTPLSSSQFGFMGPFIRIKPPTGTYDGRREHCCIYWLETKPNSRLLKLC